jgi:hypothetical protein
MSYEDFDPKDLLIQSYSTKPEGNFGPHRIPTGIRVIHLPTGTVVSCNEDRSQHKNRHAALTQLWEQVQGKPSYSELVAHVDMLREAITAAVYGSKLDDCGNRDEDGLLRHGDPYEACIKLIDALQASNCIKKGGEK